MYDIRKESIEPYNLTGPAKPKENHIYKSNSRKIKMNDESGHAWGQSDTAVAVNLPEKEVRFPHHPGG